MANEEFATFADKSPGDSLAAAEVNILRDNPVAIARGALSAPGIDPRALIDVVDGPEERLKLISSTWDFIGPGTLLTVIFWQGGSIRVRLRSRKIGDGPSQVGADFFVNFAAVGSIRTSSFSFADRYFTMNGLPKGARIEIRAAVTDADDGFEVTNMGFQTTGNHLLVAHISDGPRIEYNFGDPVP